MPTRSSRPQANDQDATGPGSLDKRETAKKPVSLLDISTLVKHTRSGPSLLEQAHKGSHENEV